MHQEARAAGAVTTFVLVVCAIALVVLVIFQPPPGPEVALAPDGGVAATWAPSVEAPVAAETPGQGVAGLVDADWLASTSAATGIPDRALAAYAGAALFKAQAMPGCGLSWNTLAAIGEVESDHGRYGGSEVLLDGTVDPAIYGIPLDGNEVANIPDSDQGKLDGDPSIDRAVGPMQLIPQTWRNWHVDGNGDGIEDPQNLDDATLATANYLCRASKALDTEEGWRKAIFAYNASDSYLASVATFAVGYSTGLGGTAAG